MNIHNKTGELPVVPNLDDIINQITQNGDFKKMMDNITENIGENGDNVEKSENKGTSNTIVNSNKQTYSDDKLYDTCCTFFSDNDGNSVADILTDINKNLYNLVRVLDKNKDKE
jgi:hypothetical protein